MSPSTRRIDDSIPHHTRTGWTMAVVPLALALLVPWWFAMPMNFDLNSPEFNPAVFVPIALGGYGLVQLIKALRGRAVGRRFGVSVFEMDGDAQVGGTLSGRVVTSRDLHAAGGFRVTLRCIETVRIHHSATDWRDEDHVRWEAEHFEPAPASGSMGVPVSFAIPDSATKRAKGAAVQWTLAVTGTVDDAPFQALFAVPVGALGQD